MLAIDGDVEQRGGRTRAEQAAGIDGLRQLSDTCHAEGALLIGQLMSSAFSADQMGLGGGMDSGSQTMLDFGKEHLARVIAEGGGLGLGKMIGQALSRKGSPE